MTVSRPVRKNPVSKKENNTGENKSSFPEEQYRQYHEDFRQLNGLFWQSPILGATVIGGLWLGVATFKLSPLARTTTLVFTACFCVIMIYIIWSLRMRVMTRILKWLDTVEGEDFERPKPRVAFAFMSLLGGAALASIIGIFFQDKIVATENADTQIPLSAINAACAPAISAVERRAQIAEARNDALTARITDLERSRIVATDDTLAKTCAVHSVSSDTHK